VCDTILDPVRGDFRWRPARCRLQVQSPLSLRSWCHNGSSHLSRVGASVRIGLWERV